MKITSILAPAAVVAASCAVVGTFGGTLVGARADESPHVVAAPASAAPASPTHTLVVAGGCFWGVQGVFEHVRGVTKAVAGYSGGTPDVGYEQVSTGSTGNAESVSITYDPAVVSEGKLLQIFFSVVLDPTTVNRQGPDEGSQYRSVVFAHSPAERDYLRHYIAALDAAHAFAAPIATAVEPYRGFTEAEGYHQNFLVRHPDNEYIAINDQPKVAALRSLFPADYETRPVMVATSGS